MKLSCVPGKISLSQGNLNKPQSTSKLIGKTLEHNGFLTDDLQLERVKIPNTCVRSHMGCIKSPLSRTFLNYFGTADQHKCESNSTPFTALLNLILKLIENIFLNRILLPNMKSVTFPVLHKTLKTFLRLRTSLKTWRLITTTATCSLRLMWSVYRRYFI